MKAQSDHFDDSCDDLVATLDDVFDAIGTLLAAASRLLKAQTDRRLGALDVLRQISVVAAALIALMIAAVSRRNTIAKSSRARPVTSEELRHLYHPPQGWAAP